MISDFVYSTKCKDAVSKVGRRGLMDRKGKGKGHPRTGHEGPEGE